MNTEHKATELNDAELDQVAGGEVIWTGAATLDLKAEPGSKGGSGKAGGFHKDNGIFGPTTRK